MRNGKFLLALVAIVVSLGVGFFLTRNTPEPPFKEVHVLPYRARILNNSQEKPCVEGKKAVKTTFKQKYIAPAVALPPFWKKDAEITFNPVYRSKRVETRQWLELACLAAVVFLAQSLLRGKVRAWAQRERSAIMLKVNKKSYETYHLLNSGREEQIVLKIGKNIDYGWKGHNSLAMIDHIIRNLAYEPYHRTLILDINLLSDNKSFSVSLTLKDALCHYRKINSKTTVVMRTSSLNESTYLIGSWADKIFADGSIFLPWHLLLPQTTSSMPLAKNPNFQIQETDKLVYIGKYKPNMPIADKKAISARNISIFRENIKPRTTIGAFIDCAYTHCKTYVSELAKPTSKNVQIEKVKDFCHFDSPAICVIDLLQKSSKKW